MAPEPAEAAALARAVQRRVSAGAALKAAFGEGALLVLGEPDALPWADRVIYLGRQQGLLLPTTLTPTIEVDLFRQALLRRITAEGHGNSVHVAVLPGRVFAFELDDQTVDPELLTATVKRGLP